MIPGICRASEIPSGASHSHSMHSSPHETVLTMLIIFAYNDVDVLPDRAEVHYAFMTYDHLCVILSVCIDWKSVQFMSFL